MENLKQWKTKDLVRKFKDLMNDALNGKNGKRGALDEAVLVAYEVTNRMKPSFDSEG